MHSLRHPGGALVATFVACMLTAIGCRSSDDAGRPTVAGSASGRPDREPPRSASSAQPRSHGLHYEELITGGAGRDERLPLVVMIHGLGDRPRPELWSDFPARARWILPRAPEPWGDGYAWFPFRATGNDPEALARGIAAAATRLAALIGEVRAARPTVGRPLVAGFSQGGMLTFALALHHPEAVGEAFPIAGLLPEPLWPVGLRRHAAAPSEAKRSSAVTDREGLERSDIRVDRVPPIHAFHGEADSLVPLEGARSLCEALTRRGDRVDLRTFPGVDHAIPGVMRRAFYEALRAAVERASRP